MPMMSSESRLFGALAMVGLVGLLVLGGCAKKNVTATTSGADMASVKMPPPPPPPSAPQSESLQSPSQPPKVTDKDRDKDRDVVQAPPTMVAKADEAEIAARKAREAAQQQLADIYFAFDKWALTNEGKKNLTQSAAELKQIPTVKLSIEGHCDERGSREYNLVLGEKRAKEAQRFLLALGVTNPVSVTSFGKERPVCTERDESCYWKNRRAHLVLDGVSGK